MTDEADYFLDNYGTCEREHLCGRDGCLRTGWLGRSCPHWKSLGVRSLDELRDFVKRENS